MQKLQIGWILIDLEMAEETEIKKIKYSEVVTIAITEKQRIRNIQGKKIIE